MFKGVKEYQETNPIILSTSKEYSIKYISEKIHTIFKNKNSLVFDTSFSDGQYKKTADNSKLKSLLKNFKFTDIDDGLTKTVEWFIKKLSKKSKTLTRFYICNVRIKVLNMSGRYSFSGK